MPNTPEDNYWGNPPETPLPAGRQQSQNASYPPPTGQPVYPAQTQPFQAQPTQQAPGASPSDPQAPQVPPEGAQGANDASPVGQPQATQPFAQPYTQTTQPFAQTTQPVQPVTPNQKQNRGVIIAVVVVVVLAVCLIIGGCTVVNSIISDLAESATRQDSGYLTQDNDRSDSDDYGFTEQDETAYLNESFREAFDLDASEEAISEDDLDKIAASSFAGSSTQPNDQGVYGDGIYHVGTDIPEGMYWFYGSDETLSYYYVLEDADSSTQSYDVEYANNYYGHNIMEVEKGDVLVVQNGTGILPIEKFDETFSEPYTSGVYRVGTDIPAGIYQLALGTAADYSAFYVMDDLEYDNDSITDSRYYLYGDDPQTTVMLKEGTYVELYNMTLTTAGSAT